MSRRFDYDAIVIGGGFFGCSLALHLKTQHDMKVMVMERGSDLLQRASYVNQARIHNGYHYPRSILTALRSRVNFPRFVSDYRACITDKFDAYYAIARGLSNVTPTQFRIFCERIGAPVNKAPQSVRALFDPDRIEDVFSVTEYAFDAVILKNIILDSLTKAGVEIRYNTEANKIRQVESSGLEVEYATSGNPGGSATANRVYNCTYSRINRLLVNSGLPCIPLKHEFTEIALVKVPEPLQQLGITVMCGPFFSVMPFPSRGLHSLTHVRYTPHDTWHDDNNRVVGGYEYLESAAKTSNYQMMIRDAQRYIPCLGECEYTESIWEVKTVLPASEYNDSRPILFVRNHGLENLACVMGGKIDNIYDMVDYEQHEFALEEEAG